jgi:hypothetical protein
VRSLNRLAQQMDTPADEKRPPAISLVLVEPMLWTRFVAGDDGLKAHIHVAGPQAGDLVLISGEDVIRDIASDRLTMGEAYRLGLVRAYGKGEQIASFLGRHDRPGRAQVNAPGKN